MNLPELDQLTERVIGLGIEVHRTLGPGLLASVHEAGLAHELSSAGLRYERQKMLPVSHKGSMIGEFRCDMIVESALRLELKTCGAPRAAF